MTDELKPVKCGCGGGALVLHRVEHGYYVRCRDCFTRTDYKVTEAEAISAWNRAMGERTAKIQQDDWNVWLCECQGEVGYKDNLLLPLRSEVGVGEL